MEVIATMGVMNGSNSQTQVCLQNWHVRQVAWYNPKFKAR